MQGENTCYGLLHSEEGGVTGEATITQDGGKNQMEKQLAQLRATKIGSQKEAANLMVELGVALTKSAIGYFATFFESKQLLVMIGWSNSAMAQCSMIDKPLDYPLEATGLWGDCVRERQPSITNDYENCQRVTRKGQPEGHVKTIRHMNVPVWAEGKIVGVLGVGNKETPYSEAEAAELMEFARQAWTVVGKHFDNRD
jgi:GAF domain-containing protein